MKRSKLKNIIEKAKGFSNKETIGETPFELFKNSLPIEIGDNYRLKAAWKAYGSPKNYQEALWEGLIQPIDENTFKLPSIGYNEETDSYEYLNTGKDNDVVNKDIRVWDNDVIPFVQELKLGGYIRTFDEELNCWKYAKGGKVKIQLADGSGYLEIDKPDVDLKAGRKPIGKKNGRNLYLNGDGKAVYADPKEGPELTAYFKSGGSTKKPYSEWIKTVPQDRLSDNYDLETAYQYLPLEQLEKWRTATPEQLNDISYHLQSVAPYGDGDYVFLKKGREWVNPEILGELDKYHSGLTGLQWSHDLIFDDDLNRYFYKKKKGFNPRAFKLGGQMNVIPEGALHAHKNHMEGAGEDYTSKGIPVMSIDGNELVAEIEREELILNKETTDKIENLYKKFKSDDLSLSEKDELAIKVGKILAVLIIDNTDDRTGLIEKVVNK